MKIFYFVYVFYILNHVNSQINSKYSQYRDCDLLLNHFFESELQKDLAYETALMSAISYIEWASESFQDIGNDAFRIDYMKCNNNDSFKDLVLMKFGKFNTKINRLFYSFLTQLRNIYALFFTKSIEFLHKYVPFIKKVHTFNKKSELKRLKFSRNMIDRIPFGCATNTYKLKWFLSNWHENGWHDTEVLISESKNNVIISFRGVYFKFSFIFKLTNFYCIYYYIYLFVGTENNVTPKIIFISIQIKVCNYMSILNSLG
jgi:hypothetical protein